MVGAARSHLSADFAAHLHPSVQPTTMTHRSVAHLAALATLSPYFLSALRATLAV
jgi:hypothetical protein